MKICLIIGNICDDGESLIVNNFWMTTPLEMAMDGVQQLISNDKMTRCTPYRWVEQDAKELLSSVTACIEEVAKKLDQKNIQLNRIKVESLDGAIGPLTGVYQSFVCSGTQTFQD
jgi:hypothetical protein